MAQRSCPRTWTPSPDMDTNASALSDDAPALAAPVTPRALGASAERDPCGLVKDLVDAAVVFRATLSAEKDSRLKMGTRVASRKGDVPRYRDARILRATVRPSSYCTVCAPKRVSRASVSWSSRRSHFNAS